MKISFPLKIENKPEINKDNFNISGKLWHFNTTSSWRLIKDNEIIAAFNYQIESAQHYLLHASLIGVERSDILTDIKLIFDNEHILQVFETDPFEPWALETPEGCWVA